MWDFCTSSLPWRCCWMTLMEACSGDTSFSSTSSSWALWVSAPGREGERIIPAAAGGMQWREKAQCSPLLCREPHGRESPTLPLPETPSDPSASGSRGSQRPQHYWGGWSSPNSAQHPLPQGVAVSLHWCQWGSRGSVLVPWRTNGHRVLLVPHRPILLPFPWVSPHLHRGSLQPQGCQAPRRGCWPRGSWRSCWSPCQSRPSPALGWLGAPQWPGWWIAPPGLWDAAPSSSASCKGSPRAALPSSLPLLDPS
ncbi:unnamed protein product [Lepidochelys olivacea]